MLLRHNKAGHKPGGAPPHTDDRRHNVILELGADFNHGRLIDPDILAEHLRVHGDTMICEVVFLFDAPLQERNTVRQDDPSRVKPVVDQDLKFLAYDNL